VASPASALSGARGAGPDRALGVASPGPGLATGGGARWGRGRALPRRTGPSGSASGAGAIRDAEDPERRRVVPSPPSLYRAPSVRVVGVLEAPLTILGGGPAGLAVAHYAERAGLAFALFERASTLGGLCRTLQCGEHRYDTGAHRFHDRDPEITADVRALLGDALVPVRAPSQILDRGRFFDFPPAPLNWVFRHGPLEAVRTAADLVAVRLRPRPERSFEDTARNRFGRRLARPLLIHYSEKLWGLPARDLAPDVATRRLSGLALASLLVELLRPARKSAHLDGEFLYPIDGYGAIAETLAEGLPAAALHVEHEVAGLECSGGRLRRIHFSDRPSRAVPGRVVSTLPLTLLARLLGDALPPAAREAASRLRFRHVRLLFLRLARPRVSRNATLYLPDPRLCVSRVCEPKNRSPRMAPEHETALVAEVPCSAGDPIVSLPDDELAGRVVRELTGVGLVAPGEVLEWRHHFLPNAYPVYSLDYRDAAERLRDAVGSIGNIDLLGRNGLFWYSHLHDQLRLARDYVASLAPRSRPRVAPADHRETHLQVGQEAVVGTPAA
jgi:protoporphyrinogen oxidase